MRSLFAAAAMTVSTGCASNTALERKVDALRAEVNTLRNDLERARVAARVTLAVKDAELATVTAEIAQQARVTITLPQGVSGRITLDVREVPWDVVLEAVVRTLGAYIVKYGGPHRAEVVRSYLTSCPEERSPDKY